MALMVGFLPPITPHEIADNASPQLVQSGPVVDVAPPPTRPLAMSLQIAIPS
jgi:hypothetical protein